ncbi:MAG: bacillithiol biosynthesis BshC, partial [Proteobacteria bacterium]|nr:bacillithiol biosynthesis BshC [Pseudomonadota bacterium]
MDDFSEICDFTAKHKASKLDENLVKYLGEYNLSFKKTIERDRNIGLLKDSTTKFVITGQQAGLFLGPLLTIYKIISCIEIAKEIQKRTKTSVVPLFWLQSEDHDIEEIDQVVLPYNPKELINLGISNESRNSANDVLLSNNIANVFDKVEQKFKEEGISIDRLEQLKSYYRQDKSYADAFANTLAELFAEDGLLIFNPRHPTVSKLLQNKFLFAFENAKSISDILKSQTGIEEQVAIRDKSPLFFFRLDKT